jgi:hypothetical protein
LKVSTFDTFREIVAVDFEFTALPGERPGPVCLVAHELHSGRRFRVFQGEFGPAPPYATGKDVLFVAYYASAELGCYRVLGWPMPERILDLFTELRNRTNGLSQGARLIDALIFFGLDPMDAVEKKEMQEAIGSDTWRGRYTPEEISELRLNDLQVGQDGRNRAILSAFQIAHGTQPAKQHQIYFWTQCMDSRFNQTASRLCRRLHRLVAAGGGDCRRVVGGFSPVGGLPIGRYLLGLW